MSPSQLSRGRSRPLHRGNVPWAMVWVKGYWPGGGAGDVAMSLQLSSFSNTDEAIYEVEV